MVFITRYSLKSLIFNKELYFIDKINYASTCYLGTPYN